MRQMHPYQQSLSTRLAGSRRVILGLAALTAALSMALLPGTANAATLTPTRTTFATAPAATGTGSTLTATVQTATGTPVTSGTVDFLLGGQANQAVQSVGSAIVQPDGVASLTVAKLPTATAKSIAGTSEVSLSAAYHANGASFADSASVAAQVATAAATTVVPDFTVTGNPTTVTTKQGSYNSTVITVTSVGGYAGSMQLSCSNLPAQVTCAFNPTQQALTANGSFTSTLELQTQGPSGTQASLLGNHTGLALAFALPGALALLGFAGRRRSNLRGLRMLAVGFLLTGASLGLTGCNPRFYYLNHGPPVAGGTPIGTFPITLAVDGDQGASVIEHDITISLVVQ